MSEEHESERYEVFQKNIDLIEKHNHEHSMGLHTYSLGINSFADWTFDEFRSFMFGTHFNKTNLKRGSSGTFVRLPKNVKVPDNVDWRTEGAVTE